MKRYSIICILLGIIFAFVGYRLGKDNSVIKSEIRVDTITITKPEIVVRDSIIVNTKLLPIKADTVYSSCIRTETINDTVYLVVDREQKQFGTDSIFDIWVSGSDVECDSIKVYRKTIIRVVDYTANKRGLLVEASYDPFNRSFVPSFGGFYEHKSGLYFKTVYSPSIIDGKLNNQFYLGLGYKFNIK